MIGTRTPQSRAAPGVRLVGLIDSGLVGSSLGGVLREQKMLKGHLSRVIHHQVYLYTNINPELVFHLGSMFAFRIGTGLGTLPPP